MRKILFLLCTLFIFESNAQEFTHEELLQDLNFLKTQIESYNPSLTHYNPSFNEKASDLIRHLKEEQYSLLRVYQETVKLCAISNEGHFATDNWKDSLHAGFLQNIYHYLPLNLRLIDEKLYVWYDNSEEQQLPRGSQIVSINGKSPSDILTIMALHFCSDANIQSYFYRQLERGFNWRYYLYVEQADQFKIEAIVNGKRKSITVKALNREKQFANWETYYPKTEQKEKTVFYKLEFDGTTAFLSLPTFDNNRMKEADIKAKQFYEQLFEQIKKGKTKDLIIDLRGNTGGRYEMADEMMAFVTQIENYPKHIRQSTSYHGKAYTYKYPKQSKLTYQGKIYVLINGRTFSSASVLARYLKEYANAIVIGEESGSRYGGFSAGSKQYVTLPNSKLEIGIPRYHTYFEKSNLQANNSGVLPDYEIKPGISDWMLEKDLVMEKAKALIKSR